MPFTISNISLLSCFRPRGLLPGLTTLLVDKVDRELVGLEVKVLLLLSPRLVRLNGEEVIFIKLRLVLNIKKQFKKLSDRLFTNHPVIKLFTFSQS